MNHMNLANQPSANEFTKPGSPRLKPDAVLEFGIVRQQKGGEHSNEMEQIRGMTSSRLETRK